jgi:hypothetical protein
MRQKQEITDIWAKLFPQFSGSSGTLQGQVKEMMVHSILMGLVPAGAKVPPVAHWLLRSGCRATRCRWRCRCWWTRAS